MDNPDKLPTLGTQDERKKETNKQANNTIYMLYDF